MRLRLLPPQENSKPKSWLMVVLFLGLLFSVVVRVFWLSYPEVRVFDEVYFPVFAKNYLDGVNFFDVHPPFGKLIIAGGIALFGDTGFGWRVMPLLFGLASMWLIAQVWYTHTKDRLASLLAAFLLGIDGLFIAYSRTGLIDGILFFFMFAALLLMLRTKDKVPLLGVATVLGIAMSIKWVGLAMLIPIGFLAYKRGRLSEFLFSLWWGLGIYFVIVIVGQALTGETELLNATVEWHIQSAEYQATLQATHSYSSPWWTWPLMDRPVLFIFDSFGDGWSQVMTSMGNPLVWWASTAAVIGSAVHTLREHFAKRVRLTDNPLFLPLIGWGACFLPFAFVDRVMFLYHYMPAYGFALLLLAHWIAKWYRRDPWLVVVLCAVFLLVSLYFTPLFVGWWPLSAEGLSQHLWFKGWIY